MAETHLCVEKCQFRLVYNKSIVKINYIPVIIRLQKLCVDNSFPTTHSDIDNNRRLVFLSEFFKQIPILVVLYLQGIKSILISEVAEYNRQKL